MHELPGDITANTASVPTLEDQSLVSAALIFRIEVLEAENMMLKTCLSSKGTACFGIEQIKHDGRLISFYTVFSSYMTLTVWLSSTFLGQL